MTGYSLPKTKKLYRLNKDGEVCEKLSGTHGLLDEEACAVAHLPASTPVGDCRVINIFRHPKNLIVSHVRWILKNPETKKYAAIENLSVDKQLAYVMTEQYKDFYEEMSAYSAWWHDAPCLRFEEVYHDPKYYFYAVGQILGLRATYPGTNLIFGNSMTYNNKKSSWREWFSPRTDAIFEKVGGLDLMQEWGYAV